MKRLLFIILTIVSICQICNAQTPINDPTVYVTENGSNTGDGVGNGLWFAAPISSDHFMYNINNGVYSGNVTVRFAGGDYYTDFVFDHIANIQSISLYGGFNPNTRRRTLPDRDFDNYETRFHATGNDDLIRFNGVGVNYVGGAGICVVDGLTLTSDANGIDYSALSFYYGDHIISQCKIDEFYSSTWLIWMETSGHSITCTNSLFVKNKTEYLMALCTHIDLINVTIADNDFEEDMFLPYCSYNQYTQSYSVFYNYNLYNSIIYGNNNMYMEYDLDSIHIGYFNVYNSILEDNEGWINNVYGNYIGSIYNPMFNTNSAVPYSCNYYTSPAIGTGNGSFIYTNQFYTPDIMDYDVVNVDRYYDILGTQVDIGAYQNGYDDGSSFYNDVPPILSAPHKGNIETTISDLQMSYASGVLEGAIITLYDVTGKIVYATTIENGFTMSSYAIPSGIYLARITSKGGKEILSKKVACL